jgi:hypothetical protein
MLAPPAASMRLAALCVAYGRLEAALLLAAPTASVRDAGTRVAYSRLEAALLLAAPAAPVPHTVARAGLSCLEAALLLAAHAAAMRDAGTRATEPLSKFEFNSSCCWSAPTATELLATRMERLLANASASVELRHCAPHPEPHTAIISAPTSAPPPTTPLLCRSLTFQGEG